jgi:hypothetical protein
MLLPRRQVYEGDGARDHRHTRVPMEWEGPEGSLRDLRLVGPLSYQRDGTLKV